jgi:hypothetical protein
LPEKIRFQCLLAHLAFQLRNPPTGNRKLIRERDGTLSIRPGLPQNPRRQSPRPYENRSLARPAPTAQSLQSPGAQSGTPFVQQFTANLQLSRKSRNLLSTLHPTYRRNLELPAE